MNSVVDLKVSLKFYLFFTKEPKKDIGEKSCLSQGGRKTGYWNVKTLDLDSFPSHNTKINLNCMEGTRKQNDRNLKVLEENIRERF